MSKQKKVLIIDDDKFLLDMYSIKFREAGFEVEVGVGGEDGLNKLRGGYKPDLVMLDIVMPGVDGFAFLEALGKESSIDPKPMVIVLSNQGQDEEIRRAKDLGATDYIIKASAIPSEVLEQVKKTIGM